MSIWSCRLRKEAKNKLKLYLFTHQHFNSIHIPSSCSTRNLITPEKNHVFVTTPQRSTQFYINTRFYAAPVQVKSKAEEKDTSGPRLNGKITANFIRLVVPDGEHVVISRSEALDRARRQKLDLVEVQRHADPPVCKLMDYHKELYVKKTKTKERAKSKAAAMTLKSDCKEVRFGMKIDPRDLQTKADTTKRLVESGYRVKCMVTGTDGDDMGGMMISRLSKLLEDICIVESGPHVEKKQAYIVVRHTKFGPPKKGCKPHKVVEAPISASSTDDDKTKSGKVKPLGTSSKWSVSDKADDFDNVFNLDEAKGESTTNSSPPSKLQVQTDNRYTRNEPINRTQQPSTHLEGNNMRPKPPIRGQEMPPRPNFNDVQKQTPVQTDSRYTRTEQPRNRVQQSLPTESNRRDEPRFRGQVMPPRPNLNEAPKQEKSIPEPPKSPPPSYGIFSTQKTNAFPKQGATEANNSNIRGQVNPNVPASNSEGGQKQQGEQQGGGFGIFSKR